MPFAGKPLDKLTEDDLSALIGNKVAEGKSLDYKRDRIGNSEGDRKEFLADVSSFANASGGHLVLGIDEANGTPTSLVGLEGDPDKEILRLETMIRDGIRPAIPGLHSAFVPLQSGKHVVVIHVPKSWNPPHQVVALKSFRFYGRASNGKHLLDVEELRSIFSAAGAAAERIRSFRVERISKILAHEVPHALKEGSRLIIQLLPLSAFSGPSTPDISDARRISELLQQTINGYSTVYNLDGLLSIAGDPAGPTRAYAQLFRNGCLEVVVVQEPRRVGTELLLANIRVETAIGNAVSAGRQLFQMLEINPPVFACLTLCHVRGVRLEIDDWGSELRPRTFDRDPVVIPEFLLETLSEPLSSTLRPILDRLWNASGWRGSPHFDADGNWKIRQ